VIGPKCLITAPKKRSYVLKKGRDNLGNGLTSEQGGVPLIISVGRLCGEELEEKLGDERRRLLTLETGNNCQIAKKRNQA